ncbi:MAG: glycosyltransferase family 4 protein [Candidatus Asgardarchaeia archaeon]
MKIAFLSDYFYPKIGGIEKHINDLSESLVSCGHSVTVITTRSKKDFNDSQLQFDVIRIDDINIYKNPTRVTKYYERLLSIIEDRDFDVIHGHHAFTLTPLLGIDIGRKLGIPTFLTAHSLSYGYSNKKLLRILSFFLSPLSNYYNATEKIFTVSNAVKEFMKNFINDKNHDNKLITLPNGVYTSSFDSLRNKRNAIREKLGISDDDINYIFIGRLVLRKGIHVLIESFKELIPYIPNAKLRIIGDGYLKYWLGQLLNNSNKFGDKITYLGVVDEKTKMEYLVASDVLIVPSIDAEAFGIVALEGLAAGIPVIATKVGGLEEIVEHEKSGLSVEPNNPHLLATAMYCLGSNYHLRKKLGAHGIKVAKEKFDWKIIVEKLLTFYQEAIEK